MSDTTALEYWDPGQKGFGARIVLSIDTFSLNYRISNILCLPEWKVVETSAGCQEDFVSADVVVIESKPLRAWSDTSVLKARTIAIVDGERDPFWFSPLRHRVAGVIGRDDPDNDFISAVKKVLSGRGWISSELALLVLYGTQGNLDSPPKILVPELANLTHREKDVALLVAEGLSNSDISSRLSIGVSTVKFHVSNSLQKLGCRDRTHLTAMLRKYSSAVSW